MIVFGKREPSHEMSAPYGEAGWNHDGSHRPCSINECCRFFILAANSLNRRQAMAEANTTLEIDYCAGETAGFCFSNLRDLRWADQFL